MSRNSLIAYVVALLLAVVAVIAYLAKVDNRKVIVLSIAGLAVVSAAVGLWEQSRSRA